MRRRHDPSRGEVYQTFPLLFWRRCHVCGLEVRRERMWWMLTGPYLNGRGFTRYLCRKCAPTRKAAFEALSSLGRF